MSQFQIHIPSDINPQPSDQEISAARIVAEFFQNDVTFIKRASTHTPDMLIRNQSWEHKSPCGNGKRTIQNNLREADNQSCFVIIDLRVCKMRQDEAIRRIHYELTKATAIKRLIVITKKVLVIK